MSAPAEVKAAAVAEVAAGASVRSVAMRIGYTDSAVGNWAKEAGVGPSDPFALPPGRWVFSPARHVQVWEASS